LGLLLLPLWQPRPWHRPQLLPAGAGALLTPARRCGRRPG
jgi:hypothetical protein